MSKNNYLQRQVDREMAEVRMNKRPPESLENKKKRCSEDKALVKESEKERSNINNAVNTILNSIRKLNDNKYAWSLGCDNTEQLLREHINLPFNLINNLNKLSKLKISLEPEWSVNDIVVLDFFRFLKCKGLVNTTLKIIDKESLSIEIKTIIKTIKRIHVEHLTNFYIPEDVLERFCQNKYVIPTRPKTYNSYEIDYDIHTEFEIKLNPSFAKSPSKPDKMFGRLGISQEKRKRSKKK